MRIETRAAVRALAACWMALAQSTGAASQSAPRTSLADGPAGRIEFKSHTPLSPSRFLAREHLKSPPVTISGILTIPDGSELARNGKVPSVILMHGTGGVSAEREHAWAARFKSWGIAAFIIDSYSGRGIKPPAYANQPNFTHVVAHVLDAYMALELLATHPRIDAGRVAIMGGSRGGETVLNAFLEPFRKAAIGSSQHRFAAFIPFYPYCSFRQTSAFMTKSPVLMLLGGADDMTGVTPCRNQAADLKARGVDIRVIVYPGAHHGFDRLPPVRFNPDQIGIIRCEAELDLDTRIAKRLDTGARLATTADHDAWVRECRYKGAHFGGDPKALAAAVTEVRTFLHRAFDAKR